MLTIDMNNFDEIVLQEKEKLVLIEFWAPWCTYCRRISSAFEAIAEEYGNELVIGKINIDEAMDLAHAIRSCLSLQLSSLKMVSLLPASSILPLNPQLKSLLPPILPKS